MAEKPFNPPFLPPSLDYSSIFGKIIKTREIIARYDEAAKRLFNPEIIQCSFATKEALLSSRIEGTQVTLDEVLLYDAKDLKSEENEKEKDYQEIFNYRLAIKRGKELLEKRPISEKLIKELHKILLNSSRGKNNNPGKFRYNQVFIGPYDAAIEQATFIPAEPQNIIRLFSDLEKYLNEKEEIDPLVKIAIAHYQFESIHPFMDGNGRVGRLLIPLFLYKNKVTSHPNIYISEFLEERRDVYYKLLNNVSKKEDWIPWINFFLDVVYEQTSKTFERVEKIEKLYRSLREGMPRVGSIYARSLLDAIFVKPTFMVKTIKEISGISNTQTLYSVIEKFVDLKIIKDITPGSARSKIYAFSALIDIIK